MTVCLFSIHNASNLTRACIATEGESCKKNEVALSESCQSSVSAKFTLEDLAQGVVGPKEAATLIRMKRSKFYYIQQVGHKRFDPTFPQPGRFESGQPFYPRVLLFRWLQAQKGVKQFRSLK